MGVVLSVGRLHFHRNPPLVSTETNSPPTLGGGRAAASGSDQSEGMA